MEQRMLMPMGSAARAMEVRVAALFKQARSGVDDLKASVAQLDAYVRRVHDLPQGRLARWVSYSYVSEPVLNIGNLERLIARLSYRSGFWWSLRERGSALSQALVGHTQTVTQRSAEIQNIASRLEMANGHADRWEALSREKDLALSPRDLTRVETMVAYVVSLRREVEAFDIHLTEYMSGIEDFRETHRRELQPDLNRVIKALDTVEVRKCTLRFEPFWTNCRKATFEEEDREQLRALFGVRDLQLAGVHGNIEKLHTAWQAIGTYVESAHNHLSKVKRQRELALFMVYFKIFLGQWKQVAVHAQRLREAFA
ncbi:hypothetical protein [Pseudomonas guariconensis]|uniref:hypothetical protein n=1 Tax=Pseudomonas guariconensis TaxID=1288410 RepID=UPI002D1F7300|nr:hypothetical protein [Pseudomonas guariconensis]MEB3841656.1 hypothetical protein [Pseudomonas guariconensis]MEB3874524.1 hypothetical protein [Pseudomonas guariconensis]MEB3880128.1 hypothetical protein [Pseudomonas guariconensis]